MSGHESVLKYYSVWKLNHIIVIRPISGRNQPAKRCEQGHATTAVNNDLCLWHADKFQ